MKKHSFSQLFFTTSLLSTCITSLSYAAISNNDLLITEVMANPSAVSDTNGEWFEIYNTTSNKINLNGLTIKDNGSNSHTIIGIDPLYIEANEYFVFGRNETEMANGGYIADYVYSSFTLSNNSDQIILEFGGNIIDSVSYNGTPFGISGNSTELVNNIFQLTPESFIYGAGDIGTPGFENSTPLSPPVAAVPVPAAGLLFCSALSLLLFRKKGSQKTITPFTSNHLSK